jgi:predicted  nucleic acid-binding Zn-ribbon protein
MCTKAFQHEIKFCPTSRAEDRILDLMGESEDLEAAKKAIVVSMNPGVYKNYERIRSRRGVAVAEVLDGRCSVCHIAVRPQYLQDLKRGEQVQVCESCQRILYYNPPERFDDIGGPSASAMHT